MGGVNYSDSFHVAAQAGHRRNETGSPDEGSGDSALFDVRRMQTAVAHANDTTRSYGVEIMSINIISADPVDPSLTRALAAGAVASAQALQSETAARGNAKAMKIQADANAEKTLIIARGDAEAAKIGAEGEAEAERLRAQGSKDAADLLSANQVAVDLAKLDRSAAALSNKDKFFFGQSPEYVNPLLMSGLQQQQQGAGGEASGYGAINKKPPPPSKGGFA